MLTARAVAQGGSMLPQLLTGMDGIACTVEPDMKPLMGVYTQIAVQRNSGNSKECFIHHMPYAALLFCAIAAVNCPGESENNIINNPDRVNVFT